MLKDESRPYSVIVYGATGFSGSLTCEYATRAELWPSKTWCIAGRSKAKVTALQGKLSMMSPNYAPGGIQVAAVDDAAAMRHLATMCDVLLNCAGPYALTGEGVVVACLEAGTHYVDITGEPQFVSKLVRQFDEAAKARSVAVVPCAGFDCVPTDLAVYIARKKVDLQGSAALTKCQTFVEVSDGISTGTFVTFINSLREAAATPRDKKKPDSSPAAMKPRSRAPPPRPHYNKKVLGGRWVLPLPSADPFIVKRTDALAHTGNLRYEHYAVCASFWSFLKVVIGSAVVMFLVTRSRRFTEWIKMRWVPGEGPREATLKESSCRLLVLANDEPCVTMTTSHMYALTACGACIVADLVRQGKIQRFGVGTPVASVDPGELLLQLEKTTQVRLSYI